MLMMRLTANIYEASCLRLWSSTITVDTQGVHLFNGMQKWSGIHQGGLCPAYEDVQSHA